MQRADAARVRGYAVTLSAAAAVLWPLLSGSADSFPLSTYPMFAGARGQPTLHAVLGATAAGDRSSLPAELVASGEVLQTKVLIQRTVAQGPGAMAQLCRRTAARVSAEGLTGLSFVDIVRRRYDPLDYFENGRLPLEESLLFRCPVPPAAPARSQPG